MTRSALAIESQGSWLAIDAAHVEEVLGPRPFTPLHGGPEAVAGALGWRAGAIAVVDVARLLGSGERLSAGSGRHRTPIVRALGVTFALPVDGVREAVELAEGASRAFEGNLGGNLAVEEVSLEGMWMPLLDVTAVARALLGDAVGART